MIPTYASLFAGIGGIDLGFDRAGLQCRWQIEIDEFCQLVLMKHWPGVPKHRDINEVTAEELEDVDVIVGGFPCQDLSHAHTNGIRKRLDGPKSSLWKQFHRIIDAKRPSWVVVENVNTWRDWVPDVRTDLAGLGYASLPFCLYAGSFGATHKRPRVVVVANTDAQGESLRAIHEEVARLRPLPRRGDFPALPRALGVADGVSDRLDRTQRLNALGNAVVPDVAEWIGSQIVRLSGRST